LDNITFRNFIILLIVALIFTGCKITKIISKEKVMPMSEKKLYNNIINNYLPYNTLSMKISAEYNGSDNYGGTIRIKKDSIIWISISKIGIEGARIQLSNDSIKFLNRLNSTYFISDYKFIMNKYQFDFDYDDIQTILTDELFLYNECLPKAVSQVGSKLLDNEEIRKAFKSYTDSNLYVLQTERKRKIKKYIKKNKTNDFIVQLIYITNDIFKISKETITVFPDNKILNIEYSEFIDIDKKAFPTEINMGYKTNESESKVKLKYSKITTNNNLSFPFNIPESYKLINFK
jgi:hypothetical protein